MSFCTSGMALMKAGAGVSEHFYSGMNVLFPMSSGHPVEDLISGAESVINTVCRFNFSDKYATLNGQTKLILEDTASSIAAISMVTHDFSANYTSRVESEDVINVNRDIVLRNLGILRDKKQQDFINVT